MRGRRLQHESLTDGCDEPVEVAVGEERLRKLPEEQLEGAGDDVHVLPLAVLQVQLLCVGTQQGCTGRVSGQQGAPLQHLDEAAESTYRDQLCSGASV